MNGATALDCAKMISKPNKTNTTTIGTNQYFFSCLRNDQNSDRTRPLLIERLLIPPRLNSLIHPRKMVTISIPARVRRPPAGRMPAPERIFSAQPRHDTDWHEHKKKHHAQQQARVEIADRAGHSPPPHAGPREK